MKIKIESLSMGYSEQSAEQAADRVSKQFGVIVELTGRFGDGGWPLVDVIGRPYDLLKMLTEDDGWSTGDEVADAELVYSLFKDAKPVFG